MELHIRPAKPSDSTQMSALLNAIIATGGTTNQRGVFDHDRMLTSYISPPNNIGCSVAVAEGNVFGFQSLYWSQPVHEMPKDWAVIATFVSEKAHGKGVGRQLFQKTLEIAKAANVHTIEATIRRENTGGIAFYERMGFVDYAGNDVRVSKKLVLFSD